MRKVENGYIGVIFFVVIVIYIFVKASVLKRNNQSDDDIIWINYVRILSIINLILFFYNDSLRGIYTSFIIGSILSVVFLIARKN